jgi:hypothetical protein
MLLLPCFSCCFPSGLDLDTKLAAKIATENIPCVGLMGIVPLTAGPYAIAITAASSIASLPGGGQTWVIEAVKAIPLTACYHKLTRGAEPTAWEATAMESDSR